MKANEMGARLSNQDGRQIAPFANFESLPPSEMAVLSSMRDPFCVIDRSHRILRLNKAMSAIYGKPDTDFAGKRCFHFFHNRHSPCQDCPLQTVFKTGRSNISERYHDFSDGHRRWGNVRAYPIRGSNGIVLAAYVVVIDITDLKRKLESQQKYSRFLSQKLHRQAPQSHTIYLDDGDIAIHTSLSKREKDVLRLIAEGHTNTQASELLGISPHTVKTHVINIFNKLGINDRTQAAVMAVRYNLI